MQSQINKWGNSAAVRIPAKVLAATGLGVHSNINIEAKDGKIVIESIEPPSKSLKLPFSEADLLQDIDSFSAHADEVFIPLSDELSEL